MPGVKEVQRDAAGTARFDYLIVGGGSAGCVLAARLSEDPRRRVCLVEAGPDTPPEAVPASIYDTGFLPDYFRPERYWTGLTAYLGPIGNRAPEEAVEDMLPRRYEQGRVMGGGSSVNAQIAIRGLPADYDEWAARGAAGWSFAECLPYFRKLERDMDFDGPRHGRDGPVPIRRTFPEQWSRFALAFRDAVGSRGIPYVDDPHAHDGDACFPFARNNAYDRRVSAAVAYLDAATRRRPNLCILADAMVEDILFEGSRATGVRLRRHGAVQDLRAGEVIVSAGALHSPAILLRAGIGAGGHLQQHGIAVRADRPGVGTNLQDHPLVGFGVYIRPEGRMDDRVRTNFLLHMRWSSGHPDCPPTDMKLTVSGRFAWNSLGKRLGMVHFGPNKAFSRGVLRLRGPKPEQEPLIAFNLLSDERDLSRMKDAVRQVHGILSQPPVRELLHNWWPGVFADSVRKLTATTRLNRMRTGLAAALLDLGGMGRRVVLGAAIDPRYTLERVLADEAVMEEWIRLSTQGGWHACGTCRMGDAADPGAVVDPHGRVIGVEGLRVVDASIMPTVPCANTNLTTIMIGEKMADHIAEDSRAVG